MAKPKLPPLSPELKRFVTNAKKILRDVAAYVADGGDLSTHQKVETKFYSRRDRLGDMLRPLGLASDPVALQLYEDVRAATKGMRDAASATRRRGYDAAIARLRQQEDDALAAMGWEEREVRRMHKYGAR